jgi:class 3 adenylate cyclase/predicted ATPase
MSASQTARVPFSCPSCGFSSPPGFRFCGACGNRLITEIRPTNTRGPSDPERRQLTVMFCDLVGSTRLATALDLEEWRDVLRAFQAACSKVVRDHGGTISRFMGDGILVLFGYPHAHEDDAERAIRAALGMVGAVARLPSPLDGTGSLAVRIGIATGLVVAGDLIGEGASEEEAILGETPNLASRLQAAAPPHGIVIASSTHNLLGGRFLCEDMGTRSLKGFRDPVPCWRVVRVLPVVSNFKAAGVAGREPLVGREDDVTWLLDLWRSATGHGGRVAMLAGEAGIGKSRLAETLTERIGATCIPLHFQCSPHYVNRALHPVIQHIELAARISLEDSPAAKTEKLVAWLDSQADGEWDLAILAALLSISEEVPALPDMSAQRRKQATFDLLLGMLRTQSAERPLLIIFEDLHWVDPTTMEFLSMLVRHIGDMAALAIFTFRSGFAAPWSGPEVHGRELARLPRESALSLAGQVAGAGRMPKAVLEQVVVRADGIPLYVEELIQAVIDLGVLDDSRDGPSDPSPVAIPATLQNSLMARLDQLGPAKLVAQLASAIGREFSYRLLGAIAPMTAERLRANLAVLETTGLIHSKGRAPDEVFAFKHALVQEIAYQSLLRGRRHELHSLIALALHSHFPQQWRNTPELLAYHWTQAGETERAIDGWLAAGERARERSEYSEAIGHLRKGIDLVNHLAEPRERRDRELTLLLALGTALIMATGPGTPDVAGLYARALDLCADIPKSGLHFAARWGSWLVAMDHRAGLERADDLLHLAQELGDPASLVQAHHCQWATLYMLGAHEECCKHADEGIRLYDPQRHHSQADLYGGHDPKVCALGERALSCWLLGRFDESLQSIRSALEWGESLGHVGSRIHAMDYALVVHRLQRDPEEVERRAKAVVAFATEQRLGEYRARAMLFQGWASALLGDVVGGIEEMRSALAAEVEAGVPADFPLYYEMFAEVCQHAERFDEGLDAVRKGLAHAERARIVYWNAELHRRQGELMLAAGAAPTDVAPCFERSLVEARAQGAIFLELRAATSLVRLHRGQGQVSDPGSRLRAAYAGIPRHRDTPELREARALLAAVP